jgi:hypothetical protein
MDVFAFGEDEIPELYVTQTPIVNAGAVGVDRPFIVLNSGNFFSGVGASAAEKVRDLLGKRE